MEKKMIFYDYTFKTEKYQNSWRCILSNTYENMELYYRKQMSMKQLLSTFRKAFRIPPITIKNSEEDKYYKYKLLAIYLLTKYSKEEFEHIAKEFNISILTVNLIFVNNTYMTTFQDDIKSFFKQLEEGYLLERKTSLAFSESTQEYIKTI